MPAADQVFTVDELLAYELAPAVGISIGVAKTRLFDDKTRILLGELEGMEEDIAATVEGLALIKAVTLTPTPGKPAGWTSTGGVRTKHPPSWCAARPGQMPVRTRPATR
ncbi:MAG: hypothetical protein QOE76_2430 [Frankiales bacterium]|nr:hypothetical protein [Frankiales bacterium]MDX6244707.1 hypothetical protein [Frankiales bacterium]